MMGFWVFMLIMVLLIPIAMIVFGRLFSNKAPKDINHIFGYRTKRSMMKMDTWKFAHAYIGKFWLICGLILMPRSVAHVLSGYGDGKINRKLFQDNRLCVCGSIYFERSL